MSADRIAGPRSYTCPPLVLEWNSVDRPLPLQTVRGPARNSTTGLEAPPWIETGDAGEPFHFSESMRFLCADIAQRYDLLRHVDVSRMIFAFTPSRTNRGHGLQARVTPLRFRDGERTRLHRGIPFQVQQFLHDRKEMLYILAFCLPRFLNRDFEDKFVTIFHELFHISPKFDGDLRRHGGRYNLHTASQKRYDREMAAMAREYFQSGTDPKLHGFLRLTFAQLRHRHGRVVGHVVPRPKLIPMRTMFPRLLAAPL